MYSDGGAANDLAVLLNKAQYSLREEAVVEGDDALRLRWPVPARLTTILMPRGLADHHACHQVLRSAT